MALKVAIQGVKGSYHHEAVGVYFGNQNIDLLECETFDQLAQAVASEGVNTALMAIENSIAGAILPNYALISKHNLKVVGEVYLSIQHQLMAIKGVAIEEIKEVRSHYMALLQCDSFIEGHSNWKIVEAIDTALSASDIATEALTNVAAIASKKAAEVYDLNILAKNIQTFPDNFTRFFVLEKNKKQIDDFDKASIRFVTNHQSGALVKVLSAISNAGINMDKIQSVPIISKPWKYSFHVDMTFDDTSKYYLMREMIKDKITEIEVLGEYKNGRK